MNIVNIFNTDQSEIIKKLEIDNGTYVVFGSNKTIEHISHALEGSNPRKLVKMGTGLSISVVLDDADIPFAAEEICTSAAIDRGNDCVSTNIVYVQEGVWEAFLKEVNNIAYRYESKDPFEPENITGHIHKEDVDTVYAHLCSLKKDHHLKGYPDTIHLSIIELEEEDHFEEFPGPVLGVRKFTDLPHFFSQFAKDMQRNNLEKNLITSVFTKNTEAFEQISSTINSYTFKLNKGSQKMNFLLEHQGMYLIKELLDKRILEE